MTTKTANKSKEERLKLLNDNSLDEEYAAVEALEYAAAGTRGRHFEASNLVILLKQVHSAMDSHARTSEEYILSLEEKVKKLKDN